MLADERMVYPTSTPAATAETISFKYIEEVCQSHTTLYVRYSRTIKMNILEMKIILYLKRHQALPNHKQSYFGPKQSGLKKNAHMAFQQPI